MCTENVALRRGGCPVGQGGCPSGTWSVSQWYMVGVPVVHGRCPSCTRSVSQLYTVGVPVVHGRCPSGTRSVSQWYTVGVPVVHGRCPSGTWPVSQWYTVGVPVVHGRCPSGTWSVSQWYTVGVAVVRGSVPMGHGACPSGTRWVSQWYTRCVALRHRGAGVRRGVVALFQGRVAIGPLREHSRSTVSRNAARSTARHLLDRGQRHRGRTSSPRTNVRVLRRSVRGRKHEAVLHASKNVDELRPPPCQPSGEDARGPAVETTALLLQLARPSL
jgi:hypothetical protein